MDPFDVFAHRQQLLLQPSLPISLSPDGDVVIKTLHGDATDISPEFRLVR
jgi:hypothetical protein